MNFTHGTQARKSKPSSGTRPLIDEETFELAQKRAATRHRPTKSDEIDLFSGLLYCADCGYKMYLQKGAGTPERNIVPELPCFRSAPRGAPTLPTATASPASIRRRPYRRPPAAAPP
jgi:hypothetical protein